MKADLESIRARLRALDDKLVELVAERQALALLAAEAKFDSHLPVRFPAIEEATVARCRERALALGVPAEAIETVMRALIESSVQAQETRLAELNKLSLNLVEPGREPGENRPKPQRNVP